MTKRDKFIKLGLCGRCGKFPFVPGIKLCVECREYHKQYAANEWKTEDGKQKRRKWLSNWQKANPDKVRERAKMDYHKAKSLVFNHYGRICNCCNDSHEEFLTIDHINNDGNKERKNGKYNKNFYKQIISLGFPNNLQTLCWNCNVAKGIYGLCPHQKEKVNVESGSL